MTQPATLAEIVREGLREVDGACYACRRFGDADCDGLHAAIRATLRRIVEAFPTWEPSLGRDALYQQATRVLTPEQKSAALTELEGG